MKNTPCISRLAIFLFVLLIPCTVYWPLAEPLTSDILPIYVAPGLFFSDLLVAAVLITAISQNINRPKKSSRLALLLLILIGLGILTIPFAISPRVAGYTVFRWVLAAALYRALARSDLPVEETVLAFLGGLGGQALVGAAQFWQRGPLGIPGEMALDANQAGAAFISINGVHWLRAYGITFHPNVLGGFMLVGLILGLPLLARKWVRVLWWLLCLGLLLSFSRSAWLAALIVLPVVAGWLYIRKPDMQRPLEISLAVVFFFASMGVVFLWDPLKTRLLLNPTNSEMASLSGRGELIALALRSILRRPLTGVGAGNFPLLVVETETPTFAHYIHNVPLLLAAEVGLLAGLLWYGLWLTPVGALDRFWRNDDPWPIVIIGAWFALGLISLWDSYPWALESGRLLSVMLLSWVDRASLALPAGEQA